MLDEIFRREQPRDDSVGGLVTGQAGGLTPQRAPPVSALCSGNQPGVSTRAAALTDLLGGAMGQRLNPSHSVPAAVLSGPRARH